MKTSVVTITPNMSKSFLMANTKNRPINRKNVLLLAKEMRNNRWKLNGDTIKICKEGYVIDGQHRFLACVESGIPFETVLIEGLDFNVFDTIDTGLHRSAANTLSLRGEINTTRLASALVVVDKYMTSRVHQNLRYTNTEVEELLKKYPEVRESVRKTAETKRLISPSVLTACHYLFSLKDADAADKFVNDLIMGRDLQEGDPVYFLRERLINNMLSKAKLQSHYIMGLLIKAWNFRRQNKNIKNLRFNMDGEKPEMFPVVL